MGLASRLDPAGDPQAIGGKLAMDPAASAWSSRSSRLWGLIRAAVPMVRQVARSPGRCAVDRDPVGDDVDGNAQGLRRAIRLGLVLDDRSGQPGSVLARGAVGQAGPGPWRNSRRAPRTKVRRG